jgi:RNA polymerase sigma factor (TIGR02999 family)
MGDVTQLLERARHGDPRANDALYRAVYDDLKRLAWRVMPGRDAASGGSRTSLVHDAFLRLARPGAADTQDRRHFFSLAARIMRQIAIDRARERTAAKRGGGVRDLGLSQADLEPGSNDAASELIDLDRALTELATDAPRLASVVELRVFADLELTDIADTLDLSLATVKRDLRKAQAWLAARLDDPPVADESRDPD